MFAKVTILCVILAAAHANPIIAAAPIISTGVSTSARQQDGVGNYAFNYGIADGVGATNSRAEVGDVAGNKKGSYTITDIDGRARRVDYVADALGFRASVNTNEPGTALSAPAAAAVISPYAAPVAPVATAPIVASAPVAQVATAPIVSSAPLLSAPAPVSSYSSVIGHGVVAPALVAAPGPIAYSNAIGHGVASPLGLGLLGAPLGKSLIW